MSGRGQDIDGHACIGNFLLVDNDFSRVFEKSASDQLRQMCLSQLTASDELAQMRNTVKISAN